MEYSGAQVALVVDDVPLRGATMTQHPGQTAAGTETSRR